MLQYVHTDAACCRHEPGVVADRQAQVRTCHLLVYRRDGNVFLRGMHACKGRRV